MKKNVDDAKRSIQDYEYALIYMIDEVRLTEVAAMPEVDWSKCLEARFFSEKGELRFWRDGDEMVAAEVSCARESEFVTESYKLDGRFKKKWESVSVKQFLDFDSDGQAYVDRTVLSGLGRKS